MSDITPENPVLGGTEIVPTGLTLRDWLAGQALAGFSRARESEMFNDNTMQWYARSAYELADAMLAERDHEPRKRPVKRSAQVGPPANVLWPQLKPGSH